MQYIITDWASNVCFKSDLENFTDIDSASEYLDYCLQDLHGANCDLEIEREEYTITPLESNNKIMGNVLYQFN